MIATLARKTLRIPVPAPAREPIAEVEVREATVIPGDGVGPEVVAATLHVLDAAGARVRWEYAEAGARAVRRGAEQGLPEATLRSIRRTGVVLTGPLSAPGDHAADASLLLRRRLGASITVRPARELPGIGTPFSGRGVDLVLVSESPDVGPADDAHAAAAAIVRAAFALARADGRETVHCAVRGEGVLPAEAALEHAFRDAALAHPDVGAECVEPAVLAMRLVTEPEHLGVVLATGMAGEVLSGVAAGLGGGGALAPRAHLGDGVAIFEPAHGPASRLAGRDAANPTATLRAAVMLLRHVGDAEAADEVERALACTLDQGFRTPDVPGRGPAVTTSAFADAVVANLGRPLPGWTPRRRGPRRWREG